MEDCIWRDCFVYQWFLRGKYHECVIYMDVYLTIWFSISSVLWIWSTGPAQKVTQKVKIKKKKLNIFFCYKVDVN